MSEIEFSTFAAKLRICLIICKALFKLMYIFGHVLIVNSRFYGRCYVKKLIPLSTFLKFHTYLDENLARSFQNVFD